nr:zf-HC2 domain-containing protein [uncultured Tyzzerella sp.]
MNCREICNKMFDYIEHQLSQQEIKDFEEHMKDCKNCQNEYYKLEKLTVKLKNIKDIQPPNNLKYKILENIKNEAKQQKKKSKIAYFKKYSYVAATMIVFLGGFYMLKALENSPVKNDIYSVNSVNNYTTSQTTINIQDVTEATTEVITQDLKLKEDNKKNTRQATIENIQKQTENTTIVESKTEIVSKARTQQEPSQFSNTENLQPALIEPNEVEIFNNSRSLNANIGDNHLYEKTITKDNNIQIFKYDIPLYKNQICNVYFENSSQQDVHLYVENIDGEKVSQDTLVEKSSNNSMQFYMAEEELEQDVYTINVKAADKNFLEGYLKIEILQKNNDENNQNNHK